MLLAIMGYVVFALMIYLLMSEKAHVIVAFALVPVVGCVLAGIPVASISAYALSGIGKVSTTIVMLIFAVLYFALMNDTGMFEGAVNKLAAKAGDNVVAVAIVTAFIAALGHLDGASASTVLITVPLMMPIYKRLHMRMELLLFITGLSMAFMTFVSWNGSTAKAAVTLGISATTLWHDFVPTQIVTFVVAIIAAGFFGFKEKQRIVRLGLAEGGASADLGIGIDEKGGVAGNPEEGKVLTERQKKLVPVNVILTIIIIVAVIVKLMDSAVLFMLGTCIALIINYPKVKEQQAVIKKYASLALITGIACMAAGVMIGTVSDSGMLQAMVEILIKILPNVISENLQVLMGIISLPLGAATGMTGFYLGIMPFIVALGEQVGIASQNMFIWAAIGEHFGEFLHPALPGVILALGLTEVSYGDHLKFSFLKTWAIAIICLVIAVIMGQAVI